MNWTRKMIGVAFCLALPAASAQQGRELPRTPDGQPDLQGVWTNSSQTPLARPALDRGSRHEPQVPARAHVRICLS